jgi:HEAT repeat protein
MISDLIGQLDDSDPEVRSFAAYYLKNMGDRSAIDPLLRRLKDEDPMVRHSAVHSVSLLGYRFSENRVVSHVAASLKDADEGVRNEAAMVLGTWLVNLIEDRAVIMALIESLKDDNPEVADRAAFALENIYERKHSYDLVRPLLEAETDPDPRVSGRIGAILAKKIHIRQ